MLRLLMKKIIPFIQAKLNMINLKIYYLDIKRDNLTDLIFLIVLIYNRNTYKMENL